MFALFAIALMMVATLATKLLLGPRKRASALLRRVVSRRHQRCALGLISAMVRLLTQEGSLYEHLSPHVKPKLAGRLANVS
jgi:putative copper export protein